MKPKQFIKKYKIISAIGKGGMGVVYHALDTELDRDVAIKCIAPHLTEKSDIQKRFIREARMQAQLTHHNICVLYDTFEEDNMLYIVMELLHGETLTDKIKKNAGPLPAREIKKIAFGILNGLNFLHSKGIVHRDIKPSNIFITEDNNVKLMDLGIARSLDDSSSTLTSTKQTIGSPTYMAPEQIKKEKITFAADIYSFGMTLYEMLTGDLPFDKTSSNYEIYDFHINGKVKSVLTKNPKANQQLAKIVQKALSKIPSKRFRSAKELQKVIDDILELKKTKSTKNIYLWIGAASLFIVALIIIIANISFKPIPIPEPIMKLKIIAEQELEKIKSKDSLYIYSTKIEDAKFEFKNGKNAQSAGNFDFAQKSYIKVTNIIDKIDSQINFDSVKGKYDEKLTATNIDDLKKYSTNEWAETKKLAKLADSLLYNYQKRTENYQKALLNLISAIEKAEEIKNKDGNDIIKKKNDEIIDENKNLKKEKLEEENRKKTFKAEKKKLKNKIKKLLDEIITIEPKYKPPYNIKNIDNTNRLNNIIIDLENYIKEKNEKLIAPINIFEFGKIENESLSKPFTKSQIKESEKYDNLPVEIILPDTKIHFRLIPPGTFIMGDGDEDDYYQCKHEVEITNPFYISTTEITREQWNKVFGKKKQPFREKNMPKSNVNWHDCKKFVEQLQQFENIDNVQIDLPTEAEWEYACKAETTNKWFFGNDSKELIKYAWCKKNSLQKLHEVKKKEPNPYGLYDIYGNVREWCLDLYNEYPENKQINPENKKLNGHFRVVRGGSIVKEVQCQSNKRDSSKSDTKMKETGCRIVIRF